MKSKTSFFNKTIFMKNVTLYWPLWGLYTIILLGMQSFLIWADFYTSQFSGENTLSAKMGVVINILYFAPTVMVIAVAATIIGMAVFNYMYNSKNANMIHSLPVNKTELFGTNVISGLTFLIVPQIVTFLVSVFVCLSYGMTRVEYLAIWLLMAMATAFIAFAFVTVCAMFTGLIFALPIYVLIVNFLSYWAYYIVLSIVSIFGYGVTDLGSHLQRWVEAFCPLGCFISNIAINAKYEKDICTGIEVLGIGFIVAYLVVAVVLYVIAYVTYQKRHIETAGELISVNWLKPVFRWGVGISGGIFGSVFIRQLALELGMSYTLPVFILIMLLLGELSYFAADMFVRKTFHVFKKKNWIGSGAFSAVLLVCFFFLYGVAEIYEGYIPEKEDIASATISMGYEIALEGEDAVDIIDIHKEILKNKELGEAYTKQRYWGAGDHEYIIISYNLENGNNMSRYYVLPYDQEAIIAIIEEVEAIEKRPDIYLTNEICKKYDKVTEFGPGWLEARFSGDTPSEGEYKYEDFSYDSKSLTPEIVEKLYAAVIADTQAGTLIKYNIYSNWAQKELEYFNKEQANLSLDYRDPDVKYEDTMSFDKDSYGDSGEMVEEYINFSSLYLAFGPDCENIINTLIECGLIHSIDDIYWGEEK